MQCSAELNTYADTTGAGRGNLIARQHRETRVLPQERESVRFRERKYNHEFEG
jgi:hypothetical protein